VLTIGNFDGVHRGHQHLLAKLGGIKAEIPGCISIVQSFYPHPSQILAGANFRPITAVRKKISLLEASGVDVLAEVKFSSELSNLSAEEYFQNYWLDKCRVRHLVLGPDTAIGKDRRGDLQFLKQVSQRLGIGVTVVDFVKEDQVKLASRVIRQLISTSDFSTVAGALGRPFSVLGRVVDGDKRGRQIGFRTANIHVGKNLMPDNGVYAVRVRFAGNDFNGVSNIGVRPTFGGHKHALEVHLFDYRGDEFYGERVEVEFVKRLRAEQKFGSLEELKAQIERDVASAKECLQNGR
jgi:riboflavin kinase/FMN adenylyltransferase